MSKQYFDIEDVIKQSPETSIFYIVGQGGVGKTYSAKFRIIDRYLRYKEKAIYVRNVTPEITSSALLTVFADVEEDKRLPWHLLDPDGKFYCFHIMPKGSFFYMVGEREDGKLIWLEPFIRIVALTMAQRFKGGAYNTSKTILFDEFISEGKPPKNMQSNFSKIINTVGRSVNQDVKILCCGNPDYSIEINPLLEPLHLDYARLQDNTAYFYDSVDPNTGKIIANNVCFFKVAHYEGDFLATKTAHIYGSAEELMRATGAVKTGAYIHIRDLTDFRPYYGLIVETPILASEYYRRKIYVYYGEMWNEPVCVCTNHRDYKVDMLYCRYEETDFRRREEPQTYRINIPPQQRFADLKAMMANVDANHLIISNDDGTATLFEQIRENS